MRTDRSAMRLTGEGIELSLGVLGYQFPDEIDYWDANWLIIEGAVAHPQGSWRFRDACLTSFELRQLAEWLDGVARGDPDADSGYFTEPCLEFRYASEPEPAIDVILAHECAAVAEPCREERRSRASVLAVSQRSERISRRGSSLSGNVSCAGRRITSGLRRIYGPAHWCSRVLSAQP